MRYWLVLCCFLASTPVSADAQSERAALIQKLIGYEVLHKTEIVDGVPQLWVLDLYKTSDQATQREVASMVMNYYQEQDTNVQQLVIVDAVTGAVIGSYSSASGLQLN